MVMDNQTDPADLVSVTAITKGTGIFLIPDLKSDVFGAMNKEFIADITYADCIMRGQFAFAFKWVPDDVEKEKSLKQAKCSNERCVKTCKIRGCICNRARGICQ
jgi:hypothetical protein